MRVAEVIGTVTLSTCHPSVRGGTWLVSVPLTVEGLRAGGAGRGEPVVVWDDLGAGHAALIAFSEGAEASSPFYPEQKPIDAYNAAILDHCELAQ